MEDSFFDLADFLKKPSLMEIFVDILLCAVPIWLAVMIGLLIGWSWRPRWTGLLYLGLRGKFRFLWTAPAPPGFGARRLWLAFTALSAFSASRAIWSNFRNKNKSTVSTLQDASHSRDATGESSTNFGVGHLGGESDIVTESDLEHLLDLLEGKAGDMEWQNMMERTTPNMTYQAWRHGPKTGPIVLRSRTVYEDVSAELVRDFFWDDEFRPKWDHMLAYFKTVEECPHTGTMIVHWIKKFPFFCSDREYIIGRRIWESERTYYCVTKGVPYSGLPKHDKPRRVELYFSSWAIRPVESRKGDGELSACEVCLVHSEDMGIPKDVAKIGLRHGMWGTVKKIHSGVRAYDNARKAGASLSRSALMARITTKMRLNEITSTSSSSRINNNEEDDERRQVVVVKEEEEEEEKNSGVVDWKWIVVGGTLAVALGLHTGAVGRALLLGAGQRFARR